MQKHRFWSRDIELDALAELSADWKPKFRAAQNIAPRNRQRSERALPCADCTGHPPGQSLVRAKTQV